MWNSAVSYQHFLTNQHDTMVTAPDRNNIVASALSELSLSDADEASLLSSPGIYISSLAPSEADHVRSVLVPGYRHAFRVIFLLGSSLAAFAFVLAFFLMPQVELSRPDDEKLKEEGRRQHLKGKRQGSEVQPAEV